MATARMMNPTPTELMVVGELKSITYAADKLMPMADMLQPWAVFKISRAQQRLRDVVLYAMGKQKNPSEGAPVGYMNRQNLVQIREDATWLMERAEGLPEWAVDFVHKSQADVDDVYVNHVRMAAQNPPSWRDIGPFGWQQPSQIAPGAAATGFAGPRRRRSQNPGRGAQSAFAGPHGRRMNPGMTHQSVALAPGLPLR